MDCFICHRSNWMQEKCLAFLKNLLEYYKDKIEDSDVFLPLEHHGADELLARLVREALPQEVIEKMSENNRWGRNLDLDDDDVHVTLQVLWNNVESHSKVKDILSALFESAMKCPWSEEGEQDVFHGKMMELQRTLKLSDREIDLMLVSLALHENILCDPRNRGGRISTSTNVFMMTKCLNVSEAAVLDSGANQKPLRRFDCLDDDLDFNGRLYPFLCGLTDEPLANSYFTKDTG